MLCDSTYVGSLESSKAERQEGDWWLPGGREERRTGGFTAAWVEFQFCKMKKV